MRAHPINGTNGGSERGYISYNIVGAPREKIPTMEDFSSPRTTEKGP